LVVFLNAVRKFYKSGVRGVDGTTGKCNLTAYGLWRYFKVTFTHDHIGGRA
jgi:hypothetical protein